jgi:hypothetical protein
LNIFQPLTQFGDNSLAAPHLIHQTGSAIIPDLGY